MTEGIHMCYSAGYKLWETEAKSGLRGGISIVWREEAGWKVEVAMIFGPNIISFKITAGWKVWYVVGAYIYPYDQPTVNNLKQALAHSKMGVDTLLSVNCNICLTQLLDQQEKYLATTIANYGLLEQILHFISTYIYRGKGG